LSFAQGVRKLHDAKLFAVECEDDPDFPGANPTVYTNLWLQIKSKLLAGETGSEPWRRIYFTAFFRGPFLTLETLLPQRGCGHRDDRPALFRKPTGRCKQHSSGGKVNLSASAARAGKKRRIDHEQEHE
jgi:hypothetical protein